MAVAPSLGGRGGVTRTKSRQQTVRRGAEVSRSWPGLTGIYESSREVNGRVRGECQANGCCRLWKSKTDRTGVTGYDFRLFWKHVVTAAMRALSFRSVSSTATMQGTRSDCLLEWCGRSHSAWQSAERPLPDSESRLWTCRSGSARKKSFVDVLS